MALMESQIKASVIIIGRNGRSYLLGCLSSLMDQQCAFQFEIIYVDNASQDDSVSCIRSNFPEVTLLPLEENLGYYGAFNLAAQSVARGEYLLPLPQDTILHKKCLQELVDAAENDPENQVCLVNTVNPGSPDFVAKEREAWISNVYLMSTSRLGVNLPRQWKFFQHTVPILAYSGVSALLKKGAFPESLGFFDPKLSHFLGDVEVGIRANVLGGEAILVPTAIVYHIEDNKSWTDVNLLVRSFQGARDTYLVYFKNMFFLEYLVFIPALLIGIPTKAFALRNLNPLVKGVLFLGSLVVSPFAFIASLFRLHLFREDRRLILSQRKNGRFWLLRTILLHEIN
jgi:hypothetical protein